MMASMKSVERSKTKKRREDGSSITILVLGDERVGKSSLISTFVSRYFMETTIPGLMTRVQLPPQRGGGQQQQLRTTIVDSQRGDAALLNNTTSSSPPPPPLADSIVLVSDLSRPETLTKLLQHWLPLLEQAYQGKVPVIVAENKYDLFVGPTTPPPPQQQQLQHGPQSASAQSNPIPTSDNTTDLDLQRKKQQHRQQIVSLMQRFPFVRQCIKCSAKEFLHVDDVFYQAQQAVLYPLLPLYDLEKGQLTLPAQRAFLRMFRICDLDRDGLLSDLEMENILKAQILTLDGGGLATWKKIVRGHVVIADSELTRNAATTTTTAMPVLSSTATGVEAFTVLGFFTIFDVLINQNRLDRVWEALRKFGYQDDLQLHPPPEPSNDYYSSSASWRLSESERQFLVQLFQQYSTVSSSSSQVPVITSRDMVRLFAVCDPPLPPWSVARSTLLFRGIVPRPKQNAARSSLSTSMSPENSTSSAELSSPPALSSSGISILSASDSLPSLGSMVEALGNTSCLSSSTSLTLMEWMAHWHLMASTSSTVTRMELYRLGYHSLPPTLVTESSSSSTTTNVKRSMKQSWKTEPVTTTTAPLQFPQSRELRILVLGGTRNSQLIPSLCCWEDDDGDDEGTSKEEILQQPRYPETSVAHVKIKRRSSKSSKSSDHFVTFFIFYHYPESMITSLLWEAKNNEKESFDLFLLLFDDMASLDRCQLLERQYFKSHWRRVFVLVTPNNNNNTMADHATAAHQAALRHCTRSELAKQPLVWSPKQQQQQREEFLILLARCGLPRGESSLDAWLLQSSPQDAQKKRWREHWFQLGLGVAVVVVIGVGYFSCSSWISSTFFYSPTKTSTTTTTTTTNKVVIKS